MISEALLYPAIFLSRAHSCFLAAAELAMSGHMYGIQPLLRACLETSLYGCYLGNDAKRIEMWGSRQDSKAAKSKVRNEFKIGRMFDSFRTFDEQTCRTAEALYEDTIDWGAHPNVAGVMLGMGLEEDGKARAVKPDYLTADRKKLAFAMLTTSRVGRCSLSIFRNVFRERFDLLGISDQLCKLNAPERRLRR